MEVIAPRNNLLNIAFYQHILSCFNYYYCCCCCLILCSTITHCKIFLAFKTIMFTSHTALILPISCYPYNTPFMFEHWAKWLVTESERAHQNNRFSNSTVYVTFCFLITYSQAPKEPNLGLKFHHCTKNRKPLWGRVQSPRNI